MSPRLWFSSPEAGSYSMARYRRYEHNLNFNLWTDLDAVEVCSTFVGPPSSVHGTSRAWAHNVRHPSLDFHCHDAFLSRFQSLFELKPDLDGNAKVKDGPEGGAARSLVEMIVEMRLDERVRTAAFTQEDEVIWTFWVGDQTVVATFDPDDDWAPEREEAERFYLPALRAAYRANGVPFVDRQFRPDWFRKQPR